MTKWCEYCEKTSHDSDECWSTHAVWTEPSLQPFRLLKTSLKVITWQVRQALESFPQPQEQS